MTTRRAVSDLGVAIAAVELPHRTGLGVVNEDVAEAGPRWLYAVEVVQRAERRFAAAAGDAVLVAGVVLLLGGSIVQAAVGTAAFVLAGWLGPLYRKRSVVETQGVGWYFSALALPLLALTVAVSL